MSHIWATKGFSTGVLEAGGLAGAGLPVKEAWQRFPGPYFTAMDPNDLLTQAWAWQRGRCRTAHRSDLAAALGRITAKVFVLPIDLDQLFPPADCEAEARLIPNAEFRIVNDVLGHLGLFGVAPTYMVQIDRHLQELLDQRYRSGPGEADGFCTESPPARFGDERDRDDGSVVAVRQRISMTTIRNRAQDVTSPSAGPDGMCRAPVRPPAHVHPPVGSFPERRAGARSRPPTCTTFRTSTCSAASCNARSRFSTVCTAICRVFRSPSPSPMRMPGSSFAGDTDRSLAASRRACFAPGFDYSEATVGTTRRHGGRARMPVYIDGNISTRNSTSSPVRAPIHDPVSRKLEGILDISCLARMRIPMMRQLTITCRPRHRGNSALQWFRKQLAVLNSFIDACRRRSGAVYSLSCGIFMSRRFAVPRSDRRGIPAGGGTVHAGPRQDQPIHADPAFRAGR